MTREAVQRRAFDETPESSHAAPGPRWTDRTTATLVFAILALGAVYVIVSLVSDLGESPKPFAVLALLLLAIALMIALGFEFVNGFHDTANAVATVIYTNSMPAQVAVVWSGIWNLIGVLTSSGLVAFTLVSLLPVELILQVGSTAGFAMVFALLIGAIIWNLGTWYVGLPSSSSHALVGAIVGVGIMNQLMGGPDGTSGVDWGQAAEVFRSLLFSPLIGFVLAAALLLVAKIVLPFPALYRAPEGSTPPPAWVRGLLIFTCTGVSFFHGSNDGQKGMGLIMLVLIGTVPTVYALNHAVQPDQVAVFRQASERATAVVAKHVGDAVSRNSREDLTAAVRIHRATPEAIPAMQALIADIADQLARYGTPDKVPTDEAIGLRNDMYLVSETLKHIARTGEPKFDATEWADLVAYKVGIDANTKFIPTWVKVAVALALGLGTMVGWKRIVVTVGEKIGKSHLTYGQGAAAEVVAAATIGAADLWGWPVSTTHVLSSGVAGTMAANRAGLQWSTILNMVLAWVLTLPATIVLSAGLFWLFVRAF